MEETANTPPARPARTSVGFSGESSHPLWARAGRARIRGSASARDRMAFFIIDPYSGPCAGVLRSAVLPRTLGSVVRCKFRRALRCLGALGLGAGVTAALNT